MEPKISVADFNRLSKEKLPFAQVMGLQLESITGTHVIMRAGYSKHFIRPGGTISGPLLMALADATLYALVLSKVGMVELAVTTNLSINFLRKPAAGDVLAEARMLKLGKRLAVGEVSLYCESSSVDKPVAHATGTYSIPPTSQD